MTDSSRKRIDNRRARSAATQQALMRAAEKLIAQNGIENVSIRDIVSAAGQKNESALQYHFNNLTGLITSLHREREREIQDRRNALIEQLLARTRKPALRQICELMVQPAFDLAKAKPDFRRYIKAFGHEMALTESSALAIANRMAGDSMQPLSMLLQAALPHLDKSAYQRRMEAAVRFCSASMYSQAKQKNAFKGRQAELFYNDLIDALEGLLSARESAQTKACAR